jgi:hypothetical protein
MILSPYIQTAVVGFSVLIAFGSNVLAVEWKLTFDQLSGHERSHRIIVDSNGAIAAFVKSPKSKEFEKTSESIFPSEALEELRCKVVKLQTVLQIGDLKKKSSRDVDIKYRIIYEHNGAEIEFRWLAGQIGSNNSASEIYMSILDSLNRTRDLDVQLRPDPFLKPSLREPGRTDSR